MTTRARLALADCEHALADYEAGANTRFQWPRWVAVMTLLRSVGYVLKDVDRPAAPVAVRTRIDEEWQRLQSEKAVDGRPRHIFWDFIEAERANVVHFYDPSARVNVTIRLGGVSTGGADTPAGSTTVGFVMFKGPYQGADPRELCLQAIAFWRAYLDGIDAPHET